MLINRNNYEVYFLDFIEGRLTPEEEAGLMAFLSENPDLEKELNGYSSYQLNPPSIAFEDKESLKKTMSSFHEINENNFGQYCIAKMEGDLDNHSNTIFEEYLNKHPEKLKEYKQYLQTFLEPDLQIEFTDKQKLKHRIIKPIHNRMLIAVSIAASVTLIILSYNFYNSYRFENKKIYTSLHEKLKIDSLLTTTILGKPSETKKILASNKTLNTKNLKSNTIRDSIPDHYVNLKKREPITIVELDSKSQEPQIPIVPPAPLLMAVENRTSYLTVRELATRELKKRLDKQNIQLDGSMDLWQTAQAGIKQINRISGLNLALNKETDSTNNRTVFLIETDLLSFYSSSEKK